MKDVNDDLDKQMKQKMSAQESAEVKARVIDICKNLSTSIANAEKRGTLEGSSTLSTNPSASSSSLKKKREQLMKKHNLSKKDLK